MQNIVRNGARVVVAGMVAAAALSGTGACRPAPMSAEAGCDLVIAAVDAGEPVDYTAGVWTLSSGERVESAGEDFCWYM